MADLQQIDTIERPSPWPFELTVARLTEAISAAGLQVFAVIDHASNAREAGLSMPASTVLIYGKAAAGTPIMLAHPHSAVDLPLRALVREGAEGQTLVSVRPIAAVLAGSGVPATLAARLEPAQALIFKAIQP